MKRIWQIEKRNQLHLGREFRDDLVGREERLRMNQVHLLPYHYLRSQSGALLVVMVSVVLPFLLDQLSPVKQAHENEDYKPWTRSR